MTPAATLQRLPARLADSPRELVRTLWSERWLVLGVTAACIVASAVYAWTATPLYFAETVLMPAADDSSDQLLGGLGGEVGGLASLAGIRLGGADDLRKKALATLKSRALVDEFIASRKLMPVLFPNKWDARKQAWKTSLSLDDVPTAGDAYVFFDRKIRRVNEDQKSGIVRLGIMWRDRAQAADWANGLVRLANAKLQADEMAEARASRSYIEKALTAVDITTVREALFRMEESQLRREMSARVRNEFAYTVIDPAVAPDADRFRSPARLLILLMGAMVGALASLVAVFLRLELRAPA
jgi:uncharacterized protein involved in exopolysaccharide biosynthesis